MQNRLTVLKLVNKVFKSQVRRTYVDKWLRREKYHGTTEGYPFPGFSKMQKEVILFLGM